jgi:hypothetical protein
MDDSINLINLDLDWYETEKKPLPENFWPVFVVPLQAYTWNQLQELLNMTDFIVAPVKEPPVAANYYAIKGQSAVRKLMPQLNAEIKNSFAPIGLVTSSSGDYVVGVYRRKNNPKP